jgi:AGCS family alanine or glycine:cation symporter
MSYLFGASSKTYYNYIYVLSIIVGATTSLSIVINLVDSVFAFMAIPTMLTTIILAPKVVREARRYFGRMKENMS